MEYKIDSKKILNETLLAMNPKIKKSLLKANKNDREDLEQEIILRVVEAVINKKINLPPTFSEYKEEFNRANARYPNFVKFKNN